MRVPAAILLFALVGSIVTGAQTKKAPSTKAPATKAPPASAMTRVQATIECPSELGVGVKTDRRFCDVLAGQNPADGILVTIPPHRGPVQLSFELHNRHTYSEELIKSKRAFRKYTATIGVLLMDGTLVDRAVIQSEFRSAQDLVDRIGGGAGPGGVKAVAPAGSEFVAIQLPDTAGEQVSILGERLVVVRPDGTDTFISQGRPLATISNVMVEYRPGPPPKKAPTKKR